MIFGLLACGGPKLLDVAVEEGAVVVDHVPVVTVGEVDGYPLDAQLPPLAAALATRPPQPVTITLAHDDPWYRVRTLYLTTIHAGFGPVTFRAGRQESGPTRVLPARPVVGCATDNVASGARPNVRIDLYGDATQSWVELSARFHPVVDGHVQDLPVGCWTGPSCDVVFPEGPLRASCQASEAGQAPDRLSLGGVNGCVAPLAKVGGDGTWAEGLTATLRGLGLTADNALLISPEPRVPFARFLETTEAVVAAGLPFPRIPDAMVQGNDGPPLCTAEIRDADALAVATARWYGANRLRD